MRGFSNALVLCTAAGSLVLATAISTNAFAQGQAAAPAADQDATPQEPAAASDTNAELQEVVVTAERRATDVQATPIAITAETGEQLLELHIDTISSLQGTVPGFSSDETGSGLFNNINIRGMGDSIINPSIVTGVAVFRDGLSMGETIGQSEAMFDINNTAVLKGPQGTFVGASSTAGAVEITTNDPIIGGDIHGYVQGELGNYTDHELQGAVNLPWSETFAARIAFDYIHRNSFSKDIAAQNLVPGDSDPTYDPGRHLENDARVSLLWKPSSFYAALAKFEYSFEDTEDSDALPNPATYTTLFGAGPQASGVEAGCTRGGPLNANQIVCPGKGSVQHSQFWYPGEQPFVTDYYNTDQALNYFTMHLGLRQDFTLPNGMDIRSLTGFVRMNFNWDPNVSYSPANAGTQYHEFPDDDYYSQELDLISPTSGGYYSKLNWIAGTYVSYRYTPVYLNNFSVPAPYTAGTLASTDLIASNLATARSAAVFANINWQFTDTLQLQVGARDNWDNNFASQNPGPATAPPFTPELQPSGAGVYLLNYCGAGGPPICASNGLANGTRLYSLLVPLQSRGQYSDTVPTGKIDLNWTPAPGQNFYAFYARGYKAGGANAGSIDHPTWSPEHVNDYELGWKGRILGGHMLTQVGAYYYNYQNMQYSVYDTQSANDTGTGSVVENLAPTTIYGLEIAEQARFSGLGVNVGLSYNKSKLGNLYAVDSSRLPGGWGSPLGHPQCLPGHTYATPCFDYSGYASNISGEQNPFAPVFTANVSLDYAFRIGENSTLDPRVTYSHTDQQYDSIFQTPYNLFGARDLVSASIDYTFRQWLLQAYGTNLNNQVYIIGVNGQNINYGPPRQYGMRVSRSF